MVDKKDAARYIGYALLGLGIFFTIGAILVLPIFFAVLFAIPIVVGIVLIRKGNKPKEVQWEQRHRHEQGWGEEQ
jgi:hypothetical protein